MKGTIWCLLLAFAVWESMGNSNEFGGGDSSFVENGNSGGNSNIGSSIDKLAESNVDNGNEAGYNSGH